MRGPRNVSAFIYVENTSMGSVLGFSLQHCIRIHPQWFCIHGVILNQEINQLAGAAVLREDVEMNLQYSLS